MKPEVGSSILCQVLTLQEVGKILIMRTSTVLSKAIITQWKAWLQHVFNVILVEAIRKDRIELPDDDTTEKQVI